MADPNYMHIILLSESYEVQINLDLDIQSFIIQLFKALYTTVVDMWWTGVTCLGGLSSKCGGLILFDVVQG